MKNLYLFLSIFILTISTSLADGHNIKKDGLLSKKKKIKPTESFVEEFENYLKKLREISL